MKFHKLDVNAFIKFISQFYGNVSVCIHMILFIISYLFVQYIDPQNQAAFIFFLFFKKDL